MPLSNLEPLRLLWWNTSLSPPKLGASCADETKLDSAASHISLLMNKYEIDILALGEVSNTDLKYIAGKLGDSDIAIHDATAKDGKLIRDIGVLYNKNRLLLVDSGSFINEYARKRYKVGERLQFLCYENKESISILVSHWPSRLKVDENTPERTELGNTLRRIVENLDAKNNKSFIILMGDYNDDPFSPSLSKHLLATRDRDLARDKDQYLYNPFWRLVGESEPFVPGQVAQSICGTHYYSDGMFSRWVTYDQIIFSRGFLHDGPFMLNEEDCKIIRLPEIEAVFTHKKRAFDHLPVMSVVHVRSEQ